MVYTHEHLNVSSDHPEGLRLAQIWHDIAAIDESIDLSAIRTQEAQGEPYERWGVLWLEELPFFFRAWKVGERNIPILEGNHRRKTTWYAHAPYHPEAFTPPVGSETLSASETEFLLEGLGVAKEVRENAVKEGTLADTFREAIHAKKDAYAAIETKRKSDALFRGVISAAISLACEEVDTVSSPE